MKTKNHITEVFTQANSSMFFEDVFIENDTQYQTPKIKKISNSKILNYKNIFNIKTFFNPLKYFAFKNIILAAVIIFLLLLLHFKNDKKHFEIQISELVKRIEESNKEIKLLRSNIKGRQINLTLLENGVKIDKKLTTSSYKKKIMFFNYFISNEPEIIFSENHKKGSCYAMNAGMCFVKINFACKVKIDYFIIYYPSCANESAKIKDYELLGANEKGTFNVGRFVNENKNERKELGIEVNSLILKINNNYGHKKYTTIYKIICLGYNLE